MSQSPPQEASSIIFKESSWPASLPHPEEEFVFSVVSGNTHLHWAMHNNFRKRYSPDACWVTRIESIGQELPNHDRLIPFLPKVAIDLFRPNDDSVPSSRETIVNYMNSKRIPFITVYLVSTNPANEAKLSFLFEGLRCRLIRLKATDFYNPLPYNTIGIDRLANGKGVGILGNNNNNNNRPAMVIDGGTAMTITCLDRQGHILNGCITPGLGAKFQVLHEATGKLPHITPDEMKLAWKNRVTDRNDNDDDDDDALQGDDDGERPRPLTVFAENTREAIMAGVVKEVALFVNNIAKEWIDQLEASTENEKDHEPSAPLVVVTGSDGPILADLMSPVRCQRIIGMNQNCFVDVEVRLVKFLANRGIAQVLLDQKEKLDSQLEQTDNGKNHHNLRNELIGQRVAKNFTGSTNELTGDSTFYGVIVAINSGTEIFDDDVFTVYYDDNDSEDMEILEVYKALKLYAEKGETSRSSFDSKPKVKGARHCAKLLETFSESIKSSEQDESPPRKRMRPSQAEHIPDDTNQENDQKPSARPDDDDDDDDDEAPTENVSNDEPGAAAVLDEPVDDDEADSNARNISNDEEQSSSAAARNNVSGNDDASGEGIADNDKGGADADAAAGGAIEDFVGWRIAKYFGGKVFPGTIAEKRGSDLWFVEYDDGDEEEFEIDEVIKYSKLYKELEKDSD